MIIDEINRETAKQIQNEMSQALEGLAKKYNLKISVTRAVFGHTHMTQKVEISVVNANGIVASREAEYFKLVAKSYGLSPDDLGKKFTVGNKTFTLVGFNKKAIKMPFLATNDESGRTFKFRADTVCGALDIVKSFVGINRY